MLSRCETVSWSETALRWSADNQLAPGYSLWQYANGKWVQAPASALSGKNIVMGQATYRVVNNDVQFTVLNSTFTCTKTGETLKATYTFPAHSVTAVIVLEILNSQPVGRWDIVRPLD